ncbi:hypothetical protein MKW92_037440 [Papaver armeniacum]|nr:hypothetical protein MKW92_037440 [Papaver armeniacum]
MSGRREQYRISITGLPSDITHSQLIDAFKRYGRILQYKIWREPAPGGYGGCNGYVNYENQQGMADAIVNMHVIYSVIFKMNVWLGRKIRLRKSEDLQC